MFSVVVAVFTAVLLLGTKTLLLLATLIVAVGVGSWRALLLLWPFDTDEATGYLPVVAGPEG